MRLLSTSDSPLFWANPNEIFWARRVPVLSDKAIGSWSSRSSVASLSPLMYVLSILSSVFYGEFMVLIGCFIFSSESNWRFLNGDFLFLWACVGELGLEDFIWFMLSAISCLLAMPAADWVVGPVFSRVFLSMILLVLFLASFSQLGLAISKSLFSSRGLILSSGFSNF